MRQTLSILFTVIVVGLVIGHFLNRPKFKADTDEFGRPFNNRRKQIGLPIIEDSWVAHNSDSTGATWMNKTHRLLTKDAHHFAKSIIINNERLISEEDSYSKFVSDSVDNRVVYLYNLDTKKWDCTLSVHHYGTYPPSKAVQLNLTQADSILESWGLSRN